VLHAARACNCCSATAGERTPTSTHRVCARALLCRQRLHLQPQCALLLALILGRLGRLRVCGSSRRCCWRIPAHTPALLLLRQHAVARTLLTRRPLPSSSCWLLMSQGLSVRGAGTQREQQLAQCSGRWRRSGASGGKCACAGQQQSELGAGRLLQDTGGCIIQPFGSSGKAVCWKFARGVQPVTFTPGAALGPCDCPNASSFKPACSPPPFAVLLQPRRHTPRWPRRTSSP
jgi:hypothetical protein